jgi:hypothetical protein
MNYTRIYENLINKAKDRILDIYTEEHHIIPRCMNGDNSKENLVRLTPEEHYLAHQLLVKIHPSEYGLIKAAVMMCSNTAGKRPNNKLYGWLRRKHVESTSGKNNVNFGRPRSDEVRKRISDSGTGKSRGLGVKKGPMKEETKIKLSMALSGRPNLRQLGPGNVMSRPEIAKKVSDKNRGRKNGPHSEERKQNMSKALKGHRGLSGNDNPGSWRCCCVRCGKETTLPALTKWHKDCKIIDCKSTQTKEL